MSDINSLVGEPVVIPQDAPAEEAAPVQEQAEAATESPAAAEPAQEPEPRVVPLAALHEERSKRRELAAQVEAERRTREDMERRFEQRLAALARPPAPQPPALEENPLGHVAHRLDVMQAQQQALIQQSEAERAASQRAAFEAQLANKVQREEQAFVARQPDYQNAVAHLHQLRTRELQVLGMDELAAESRSAAELREFAFVTAAQGRSPAETAYNLAKTRGYNPAPAQDPQQRMQAAQRGTAAASSLGGGASTSGGITAKQLLAMSDEEFAAATAGDKWKKLMGAT